jgi:hypothetical protein
MTEYKLPLKMSSIKNKDTAKERLKQLVPEQYREGAQIEYNMHHYITFTFPRENIAKFGLHPNYYRIRGYLFHGEFYRNLLHEPFLLVDQNLREIKNT